MSFIKNILYTTALSTAAAFLPTNNVNAQKDLLVNKVDSISIPSGMKAGLFIMDPSVHRDSISSKHSRTVESMYFNTADFLNRDNVYSEFMKPFILRSKQEGMLMNWRSIDNKLNEYEKANPNTPISIVFPFVQNGLDKSGNIVLSQLSTLTNNILASEYELSEIQREALNEVKETGFASDMTSEELKTIYRDFIFWSPDYKNMALNLQQWEYLLADHPNVTLYLAAGNTTHSLNPSNKIAEKDCYSFYSFLKSPNVETVAHVKNSANNFLVNQYVNANTWDPEAGVPRFGSSLAAPVLAAIETDETIRPDSRKMENEHYFNGFSKMGALKSEYGVTEENLSDYRFDAIRYPDPLCRVEQIVNLTNIKTGEWVASFTKYKPESARPKQKPESE